MKLRTDRKLLGPYVTGGISAEWTSYVRACAEAGADLIEIGLPFSDPTLDGPVVQAASDRALRRGASVPQILHELSTLDLDIPLVVMTYANLAVREGFCASLRTAGVRGLIVPDLPVDEATSLSSAASAADIDLVLLAAPSSTPERQRTIAAASRGFVYAVNLMGTTGEQSTLPSSFELVSALRGLTDLPVLAGFGVSRPEQAAAAARYADGVIVGSALMRRVLDGATPAELRDWLSAMRAALDREEGWASPSTS